MKIKSENFLISLNNNNIHNTFLFYGPNFGLINLLYKKAISILSVDLNDPFNVCKIDGNDFKDNPSILKDNISTFSMKGNKRTVLLDLTYITMTKTIEKIILDALKENIDDYLLLIKANNLGSKNELVKFVESLENGVLIPCYEDNNNNVTTQISDLFNQYGFVFSTNFLSILSSKFNSDTSINLMEIKKLENFLIDNDKVTENMILSLITDNADLNLNKIIFFRYNL